jgi:hypothetical protein
VERPRVQPMKILHTVLRCDFGKLDRNFVQSELLSQRGVAGVAFEATHNGLAVEYDPAVVTRTTLVAIMRRYGALADPENYC